MGEFVGSSLVQGGALRYWGIWGGEGDGEALSSFVEDEATMWSGQRFDLLKYAKEEHRRRKQRKFQEAGSMHSFSGSAYVSVGSGLSTDQQPSAASQSAAEHTKTDEVDLEHLQEEAQLLIDPLQEALSNGENEAIAAPDSARSSNRDEAVPSEDQHGKNRATEGMLESSADASAAAGGIGLPS